MKKPIILGIIYLFTLLFPPFAFMTGIIWIYLSYGWYDMMKILMLFTSYHMMFGKSFRELRKKITEEFKIYRDANNKN